MAPANQRLPQLASPALSSSAKRDVIGSAKQSPANALDQSQSSTTTTTISRRSEVSVGVSVSSDQGNGFEPRLSQQNSIAESRPLDSSSNSPPTGRPHNQRHGAARGTRSARQEIVSAFEWEALKLEQRKKSGLVASSESSKKPLLTVELPKSPFHAMSRNRPRGPPVPRDNGLAANEETDMWNKILQDLRKAKEKNDKQKVVAEEIAALNEQIGRDGGRPTLSEHNQLDSLYRQMSKLCEEERAILQDEPSDVIKNLGLLTALRQASEAEAPFNRAASLVKSRKKRSDVDGSATDSPGPSVPPVSDKIGRIKGVQRSTSASSPQTRDGRETRDSVMVKIEETAENIRGTIAERNGQLVIGAEVVFKHNKNKQGVEGEGIQCIIKGISGDGPKKRYDVQDPEPNENGEQGAVYKTTAASLIPIPQVGSTLPVFPVGKQVLARYPDTTTFYRAEVMGTKKDTYRLKFEGEEDDKEMEVDRRFVLDIPGK
ncbi:SAGA-associated factor 29 [Aspergillus udagawae]|uniref:SAGA HAT/Core module component n=1 Tax=Aspergillus udagawae TaxID=91492 RepID=A0A8H3NI47_9EURO|nr:SAGA HAT/Core module component [Aspergillus udagawae]GFF30267.1 SAGA-associated factor 29 [Aspergillus udagawae]GFF95682.1 SAGA-associated factor 29 [Aspergillus udagawae]GFG12127.1 SAGA-associated factor 29 [Aspergillus udagawae]GIC91782.1 SAGA HAT/Core module component [Aspergillus udagawae]